MTTGWAVQEVAEAHTRLTGIYATIHEYKGIVDNAREMEQYNKDTAGMYEAGELLLDAAKTKLAVYRTYILANQSKFTEDEYNYFKQENESLQLHISQLYLARTVPAISSTGSGIVDTLEGVPEDIEDGDTITIGGRKVRFAGIDAPELGTDAGPWSRDILRTLIEGKNVTVKIDQNQKTDLYGRVLGVPFVKDADGKDINVCLYMLFNCAAEPNLKFGKHHNVDPNQNKQAAEGCTFGWPLNGKVKLVTDPPKCSIYVDGVFAGANTPSELRIPVGLHRVTFVRAGFSSLTVDLDVTNREYAETPFKLYKHGDNMGTVSIIAGPEGVIAVAYAGDNFLGVCPLLVDIPAGTPQEIKVAAVGYDIGTLVVESVPGTVPTYQIELVPK